LDEKETSKVALKSYLDTKLLFFWWISIAYRGHIVILEVIVLT
jgi:hypothetical protein